jgi:hypothetical protein
MDFECLRDDRMDKLCTAVLCPAISILLLMILVLLCCCETISTGEGDQ